MEKTKVKTKLDTVNRYKFEYELNGKIEELTCRVDKFHRVTDKSESMVWDSVYFIATDDPDTPLVKLQSPKDIQWTITILRSLIPEGKGVNPHIFIDGGALPLRIPADVIHLFREAIQSALMVYSDWAFQDTQIHEEKSK